MRIIVKTKSTLTDEQFYQHVLPHYVSTRTPSWASCKCKRCGRELPKGTVGRGAFAIRDSTGMPIVKGFCCSTCIHGGNQ